MQLRLMVVARKIAQDWTEKQQKKLVDICMDKLNPVIMGFGHGGASTNTFIQAIYALGSFGSERELSKLASIHDNSHYYQACLYAYGKAQYNHQWLLKKFKDDCDKAKRYQNNYLQRTAYALGMSLRKGTDILSTEINENDVVKILCNVIENANLDVNGLVNCLLALGWVCDQRYGDNIVSDSNLKRAKLVIGSIQNWYDDELVIKSTKIRILANKMISGETLSDEDERFLLTKLDI